MKVYLKRVFRKRTLPGGGGTFSCDGCYFLNDGGVSCGRIDVDCIVRGRHHIFRRATRGEIVFHLQQQARVLADQLVGVQKEIRRFKTENLRERAAAKNHIQGKNNGNRTQKIWDDDSDCHPCGHPVQNVPCGNRPASHPVFQGPHRHPGGKSATQTTQGRTSGPETQPAEIMEYPAGNNPCWST